MYKLFRYIIKIHDGFLRRFWLLYNNQSLIHQGAIVKEKNTVRLFGRHVFKLSKDATIIIGKGFTSRSGINSGIESSITKMIVGGHSTLTIGDCCGISNCTILCENKIVIGNHVLIGGGTMINDSNHHSTDWRNRLNPETDGVNAISAPITIKDNCFIGARCIIQKGVTIGERSIIAAGSVVTKNVPSDEMWGGNPARFIKAINKN